MGILWVASLVRGEIAVLLKRAGNLQLSQLVREDLNVEKMSMFSLIPEKVDGVIT